MFPSIPLKISNKRYKQSSKQMEISLSNPSSQSLLRPVKLYTECICCRTCARTRSSSWTCTIRSMYGQGQRSWRVCRDKRQSALRYRTTYSLPYYRPLVYFRRTSNWYMGEPNALDYQPTRELNIYVWLKLQMRLSRFHLKIIYH